MSFASPFPEVDIPSTSVYDYLFGSIDDADLDRVALVDAKSGTRDHLPRDDRPHRRVRRCAGRPRHRRRRRGRPAVAEQFGFRGRVPRHPAVGRDGHHHQRAVHRQGHRQAADRFERQDAGHRHAAAGAGQRGAAAVGLGRRRRRRARRRRAGRHGPSQCRRSARARAARRRRSASPRRHTWRCCRTAREPPATPRA